MELKIDFHVHSHKSFDSDMTISQIADIAKKKGLDGVCICDHANTDINDSLLNDNNSFIVIPAVEFTTGTNHIISMFLKKEPDIVFGKNFTVPVEKIVEETKNTCQLSTEIECQIYNKAIEKELTHEQAILLVAISKHETGNWTSYNFKNKNNLGGLYNGSKGTFYSYESLESGIEAFVNLLKNRYFGKGLNTIEEIGNVYCPVGVSNDPNGLNQHWIPKVSQYYNNYLGK
jgi:predicted metal-dependent phosphoesterase TrpH